MVSAKVVDFSNVKDGGQFNRSRIPAGDYLAKIIKVEDAVSKKDDAFQFLFTIQIVKRPSSKLPYYCKLQENQLWKLRNLLIAAGKTVPKSKQKVDPTSIVGKLIGVTIEDEEFESDKGTVEQSGIQGVFPAADLSEGDAPGHDEDEDEEVEEDDSLDDDLSDVQDEEVEEEVEEEPEEEEEAGDEWDAITDRLELRKALKRVAPDVKTSTKQTDDDIRDLIRQHSAAKAKPAAKPAAKVKPKVEDEELEGLDLDDL